MKLHSGNDICATRDQKAKNGEVYKDNFARAAAYFLGTCAPEPKGEVRRAAYELITGIYSAVADDAAAIGFRAVTDVWFAPWEQQKGREKDIKSIRGAVDKIEALAEELFCLAEAGETIEGGLLLPDGMKPGKTLANALTAAGAVVEKGERVRLGLPDGCVEGLKELAGISRANIIHITDGPKEDKAYLYFSRCVFEPAENWTALAFDKILDAGGRLVWLCGELEKRGYARIDCRDGKKISLDYVKLHGSKQEPIKMAWGERSHSGIEVSFEELRLQPCFIWIRMPKFRTVLENLDKLPAGVAEFIVTHTKVCDGCRYCVHTDKTGTRPLASIDVGAGKRCPYFPGFTMNWRELPKELADGILAVIDALDEFFA